MLERAITRAERHKASTPALFRALGELSASGPTPNCVPGLNLDRFEQAVGAHYPFDHFLVVAATIFAHSVSYLWSLLYPVSERSI